MNKKESDKLAKYFDGLDAWLDTQGALEASPVVQSVPVFGKNAVKRKDNKHMRQNKNIKQILDLFLPFYTPSSKKLIGLPRGSEIKVKKIKETKLYRLDLKKELFNLFNMCFPHYLPSPEFFAGDFSKVDADRLMPIVKREIKDAKKREIEVRPLTKRRLVRHLATRFKLPQNTVTAILDEIVALAIREIKSKGFFFFPRIGIIKLVHRSGSYAINPETGRQIFVPEKIRLTMRFKNTFKRAIISKETMQIEKAYLKRALS